MGRNFLAHASGDVANANLAAAGYNSSLLLRWLRLLCALILAALASSARASLRLKAAWRDYFADDQVSGRSWHNPGLRLQLWRLPGTGDDEEVSRRFDLGAPAAWSEIAPSEAVASTSISPGWIVCLTSGPLGKVRSSEAMPQSLATSLTQ